MVLVRFTPSLGLATSHFIIDWSIMGFGSHPGHAVLRRLRDNETIEIEDSGIFVKMIDGTLQPGDDYVGARNTVNLLTVASIERGWVTPRESSAYCFNVGECVKVEVSCEI